MNTIQMRFLPLLVLITVHLTVMAQTVPITLAVPEGVAKTTKSIELRTTTNGTTFVTAAVLTSQKKGEWKGRFEPENNSFEYKYVLISKEGTEEMEGWHNRVYHPEEKRTAFNDVLHFLGGEKLTKPTTIMLRVNLDGLGLNGNVPEQVGVMGSFGELSWNLPDGVKKMEQAEGSVWETLVQFPRGTQTDFPIKFVWEYEGIWHWEYLPGFLDHLLILDPKAKELKAEFAFNAQTGRIESVQGVGIEVNEYQLATEIYGGTRNYEYYRAMQLVDAGDYAGAQTVYARYRSHYRETNNDDFHGYLTSVLSRQDQDEQALSIIEQWYEKERDPYRKAHYRYLKGALHLNKGRLKESREAMQEVLGLALEYDQEAIRGHALRSIGFSYLQEEDTTEILKAQAPLEQLIEEHPDEQMKRLGWEFLARTGEKTNKKTLIRRAMHQLGETGSEEQKKTSKIKWVEMRLQDEELMDSTLADDLLWLEWTLEDPKKKEKLLQMKAKWLRRMGRKEYKQEENAEKKRQNVQVASPDSVGGQR